MFRMFGLSVLTKFQKKSLLLLVYCLETLYI